MILNSNFDTTCMNMPVARTHSYDVILLHGLFGTLSNWESVYHEFSKQHAIYIPSLPLYDMAIQSSPLDRLVTFLKFYITDKGLNKVVLVGNSLGGHVALLFAIKYPHMVEKIVLTGSSGLYENSFNQTFPRVRDFDYISEKVKDTFHKKEVVSDSLIQEVFKTIQTPAKTLAIIGLARSAQRQNVSFSLKQIKVPVLLIWGLQDSVTPPEVGQRFKDELPDAELKYIDECGHVPMMEQPVLFNQYLKEFLDK